MTTSKRAAQTVSATRTRTVTIETVPMTDVPGDAKENAHDIAADMTLEEDVYTSQAVYVAEKGGWCVQTVYKQGRGGYGA